MLDGDAIPPRAARAGDNFAARRESPARDAFDVGVERSARFLAPAMEWSGRAPAPPASDGGGCQAKATLANMPLCLIGMEGVGAHHLSRKLQAHAMRAFSNGQKKRFCLRGSDCRGGAAYDDKFVAAERPISSPCERCTGRANSWSGSAPASSREAHLPGYVVDSAPHATCRNSVKERSDSISKWAKAGEALPEQTN